MNRVVQSGAGRVSSAIRSDSGASCRTSGHDLAHPGQHGALVRRAEGDAGVHPTMAFHPLDVVAGDQTAEAVPDDVDPLVPGVGAQLLDRLLQIPGGAADVGGQQAVVERRHVAEPAPAQRPVHHG